VAATIVPDFRELARKLAPLRAEGRTLAVTNGCFDLLHVGHVRLLAAARREADLLVVALNSDASARGHKGPDRPVVPLAERMEVVAALAGVDFVTSFAEATADPLLEALRPDVHVKGTDWSAERVPERDTVLRFGGRVVICGDEKTHSSTALAARLRGS
jgi:rfaE bifunctional protein nucleotidyltransferase chain/domain